MSANGGIKTRRKKPGDTQWRQWCRCGTSQLAILDDFARTPTLDSIVRRHCDGTAYEWRRMDNDDPLSSSGEPE